jgi:hypothetical protein
LRRAGLAAAALLAFATQPAAAQLRPLEPIPWHIVAAPGRFSFQAGVSRLDDQRISLAGESGVLWEIANFAAAFRTGRVVLEVSGTGQRVFRERDRFDEPLVGVEPADGGKRHDSGDYRLSTTVRVTPDDSPITGAIRFGTRLPTSDNTTGLDRDATDFFATIGAASAFSRLGISAEAGLGIHGTREESFEQDDLLLYALRAEYHAARITPSIAFLGQRHGTAHSAIRGLEDLGEIRFGLRSGRNRWIRAELVKGYETFSPSLGVIVSAGIIR